MLIGDGHSVGPLYPEVGHKLTHSQLRGRHLAYILVAMQVSTLQMMGASERSWIHVITGGGAGWCRALGVAFFESLAQ